jgi:hypothetical protein
VGVSFSPGFILRNQQSPVVSSLINFVYSFASYATSRKVAGSIPDEVIEFFSIDLILPVSLGTDVYSASNRNEYQELIK